MHVEFFISHAQWQRKNYFNNNINNDDRKNSLMSYILSHIQFDTRYRLKYYETSVYSNFGWNYWKEKLNSFQAKRNETKNNKIWIEVYTTCVVNVYSIIAWKKPPRERKSNAIIDIESLQRIRISLFLTINLLTVQFFYLLLHLSFCLFCLSLAVKMNHFQKASTEWCFGHTALYRWSS